MGSGVQPRMQQVANQCLQRERISTSPTPPPDNPSILFPKNHLIMKQIFVSLEFFKKPFRSLRYELYILQFVHF